jgi:hypothetical protein
MGSKDLKSYNLDKNYVEMEHEKVIDFSNLNNSNLNDWTKLEPRIYIEDIGESLYSMPSCSSESDMSCISSSELKTLQDFFELSFDKKDISITPPLNILELSFNDIPSVTK